MWFWHFSAHHKGHRDPRNCRNTRLCRWVCRLIQLSFSSGWYLITGDASDLGLFCSETLLEEKDSLCCQKTSPDWSYSSLDLFIYKYYMIVIVSFVAGVIFSFKIFFQMQSLGRQRRGSIAPSWIVKFH